MMRAGAWIACLLTVALGACDPADDTETGDDAAGTDDGNAGENPPNNEADGTFSSSIAPIISASCGCHISGAGGLVFGNDAYAALVDQPANGASLDYVTPGDVEGSYLVHKIRNTQASVGGGGGIMPQGGMLTDDEIATIEDWIEDGAPE